MTDFVCDSSAIISLESVCNAEALSFLKEKTGARFVITPHVFEEMVKHPLQVRKFEYSASRIQRLVDAKVLEVRTTPALERNTQKVLELANRMFLVKNRGVAILHRGEAECIALFPEMADPGALLIDEKTARLILEDPGKLEENMAREYAAKVMLDVDALESLRKMTGETTVLRSTEVLAAAAKHGFFDQYGSVAEHAFHGAIHALRNSGAAIASEELREYDNTSLSTLEHTHK